MNLQDFSRVEARCPYKRTGTGLYGRDWETCEGSRGIASADAAEWIADMRSIDDAGEGIEYRFVPGRELTGDEHDRWLRAEDKLGRLIPDAEAIDMLLEDVL